MLLKALMKPLQEREERERIKIEQMQVYVEQLKVIEDTLIFFPYISECP